METPADEEVSPSDEAASPGATPSEPDESEASTSADGVDLLAVLSPATVYSLASLCAIILGCDFDEEHNAAFRKSTAQLFVTRLALPASSHTAIFHLLEGSERDDVSVYSTTIRSDPFCVENGCIGLISDMVSTFIQTGSYDARHRVMIRHIAAFLGVDWLDVEACERAMTAMLNDKPYEESDRTGMRREKLKGDELKKRKKRERNKKIKRWGIIGATGVVGGVLIGLTGGLAAPLIAGGLGVVIGSGAAAGIATVTGAAVIGSVFGVAGAGLSGYKMNKRVGALEEFVIETLTDGKALNICITVSGWITEDREDTFRWAWRYLEASDEQYSLRYESKYLLELGKAVEYLMSFAVTYGIQQTLMQTALSGLVAAIAWPLSILSVATVVDNPWNVCARRSVEAGNHLATLLLSRQQGRRPVTLLGFSLGARVIYHCLLEMSKRKDCDGIIEDVVLLGAPVAGSSSEWTKIARVVSGHIINGYSTSDWLLKFLYRTMNLQASIAGTAPISSDSPKILNVNVSHIITGHSDYQHKLTAVLAACGVRVAEPPTRPVSASSSRSVMTSFPSVSVSTAGDSEAPIDYAVEASENGEEIAIRVMQRSSKSC